MDSFQTKLDTRSLKQGAVILRCFDHSSPLTYRQLSETRTLLNGGLFLGGVTCMKVPDATNVSWGGTEDRQSAPSRSLEGGATKPTITMCFDKRTR